MADRHRASLVLDIAPGAHRPAVDDVWAGRDEVARWHDRGAGRREPGDELDLSLEVGERVAPDGGRQRRDPKDDRSRREVEQQVAAVLEDHRLRRRDPVLGPERDAGLGRRQPRHRRRATRTWSSPRQRTAARVPGIARPRARHDDRPASACPSRARPSALRPSVPARRDPPVGPHVRRLPRRPAPRSRRSRGRSAPAPSSTPTTRRSPSPSSSSTSSSRAA